MLYFLESYELIFNSHFPRLHDINWHFLLFSCSFFFLLHAAYNCYMIIDQFCMWNEKRASSIWCRTPIILMKKKKSKLKKSNISNSNLFLCMCVMDFNCASSLLVNSIRIERATHNFYSMETIEFLWNSELRLFEN